MFQVHKVPKQQKISKFSSREISLMSYKRLLQIFIKMLLKKTFLKVNRYESITNTLMEIYAWRNESPVISLTPSSHL